MHAPLQAGEREKPLGAALSQFDSTLRRLRDALASDPQVFDAVFAGAEDWSNLLSYKLVPHLAGDGCLIVAVAGGTNTGKSTVFNLLLGRELSPMAATAAATARPVIAANPLRAQQCLDRKLVPEFEPHPLRNPGDVLDRHAPPNALFVAAHDPLPESLVLFDTPDVDSIERDHWAVADAIGATGDVVIAVLTGEKYADDRVVTFFRNALASGRVVIPLMNKANPAKNYEVARKQLEEFRALVGTDVPDFVLPHDFTLVERLDAPITTLDGGLTLVDYIRALDVHAIKTRVYRGTVAHFAQRAAEFLENAMDVALNLRTAARELETLAQHASTQYDPTPGTAVGGLFHEFVQSKRGLPFKLVGAAGRAFVVTVTTIGRSISGALTRRAILQPTPRETEDSLRRIHTQALERITRDFATACFESASNMREPAAHLVESGLRSVDIEPAARAVVDTTLRSDNVSDEFREYAYRTLEDWWKDHRGKRMALQAIDGALAVTPAAIAGAIAAHTAGVGVDVALAVGGPMAEQFAARVIEYQFGDALFDFLSPWRKEQRATLERALLEHVAAPSLSRVHTYLDVLDGDIISELRRLLTLCSMA